jgi:glycosyltransferase involved in cell wall biosynthesis
MRVVHINQSDIKGGAAIAAHRLHQGLLAHQVDSHLLVGEAQTDDDRVATIHRRIRIESTIESLTKPRGLNHWHQWSSFGLRNHPLVQSADIINFHNLHTGFFSYLAMPWLVGKKPAVFTLHDMWAFTGHCSYAYDCDRWQVGCGQCPALDTYPAIEVDNTQLEWRVKQWIYEHSNLTIVCPSEWLLQQAQKSMMQSLNLVHIPHGVDTQVYQPLDQQECRKRLGLPSEQNIIMFAADNLKDSRKGGDLLIRALQMLPQEIKENTVLLTIGHGSSNISELVGMKSYSLGYLKDDHMKAMAYSSSNLFVFPTRADIFGLVALESIACATPVVSFEVGGVPEFIHHEINGYIVPVEDTLALKNQILRLLENPDLQRKLGENGRETVRLKYDMTIQAQVYANLYESLCKKPHTTKSYSEIVRILAKTS